MDRKIDRRIRAGSTLMQTLSRPVVLMRELSRKGEAFGLPGSSDPHR